jgi:hypothetical protein
MSDVNNKAAIQYLRHEVPARSASSRLMASAHSRLVTRSIRTPCRPVGSVRSKRRRWLDRPAMTQAGDPDAATAEATLHGAARDQRITLTEHAVAIERAGDAVKWLDAYIGSICGTGALVQFNKEYKQRRTEATESGCGFMTYNMAFAIASP